MYSSQGDTVKARKDSLLFLSDSLHTYSINFNWSDTNKMLIPSHLFTPEYYKSRYAEEHLMTKVVDNWGKGFDSLYGTRNLRPILHGVAYRGGANNYYHKTKKRKNSNPLPIDGIDNLCKEGFSHSVYLYRKNWENAPASHSCNCNNTTINKMDYSQFDYYDEKHVYDMLKLVYESAKNDSVGPVYLHCWNGWHASGFISAVILKQFCGYSDLDATAYWDIGTDGANTSPRYNKIRQRIKDFKPYSEFLLTDEEGNRICPPMPVIEDSSQLHLTIEHLAIVPEAIPVGTIMILEKVKFGPGKTTLTGASNNEDIKLLLEALEKSPSLKLEIGGHTDKSGNASTNKKLSQQRAKWVHDFLISKGIDASRLTHKGYGHYKPAYTNRTKDGRAANRRIEVKVLSKNDGDLNKLVDEGEGKEEVLITVGDIPNFKLNQTMVLEQVLFEPGKSHINDTNKVQLDELILVLKEHETIRLEIGGYTDMSGIPEKNVIISQDRAKSVYNYLIENGIEATRLSHQGFGAAKPIAPNKYRWGRDKNRRIEVKVIEL